VGPVDDRDESQLAGAGDDLVHRQNECGLGRDVTDVDGACPLACGGEQRVDDLARVAERKRNRRPEVVRARVVADPVPHQVARAVFQVGREDLVAWPQVERAGSEVDAGRGVLDEREISIRAADVTGEGRARLVEQAGQAAREEVDGFELELPLPGLVALEDAPRARAERSVVEERHVGVEQELAS
jgi:hypothetical protein